MNIMRTAILNDVWALQLANPKFMDQLNLMRAAILSEVTYMIGVYLPQLRIINDFF